ncbi:hypothetical protein ABI_12470 [Asticcacaulis biprosthecium C19]|uniref:DUF423 domain-containing protein n=1 Tax=Asticcacaulis biprosthecium C19 TaxID=715226 RepID=F4QHS2_9CAUL|nr:DUF423 domain-containing protein [Asticcacaulis biprosthecium]EGF92809.1 hypothetical protein ABI_12470 [Asticcacaulis biprosthecium C19]
MTDLPEPETKLPYFFAGMMGFVGVIMLAMGSHPPSTGILATGGQFLLLHAPAVMTITTQRGFSGVYKRAAQALLLVGPAVFAGQIAIHAGSGNPVPFLAPIGGGLTILGWLCAAIGAIRAVK